MERSVKRLKPELISRLRSGVALTCVSQCVEELVLNAIDAEANCIAVRLNLNFGKIQVIDNGHGIPPKHLDLIGERYVSSKCHTIEDLTDLKYHGFRGEALASVQDVSAILEITTRVAEASHTYFKSFHFGKLGKTSVSATPRPSVGTTVTVLDFLYNLPVRKNLTSEERNVEDCRLRLECIALMHPTVSFSLRNDATGDIPLQTRKCNTILGTFAFLFGQSRVQNMKDLDYKLGKLRLQGLMSIENSGSKEIQFLYVNRRRVVKTGLHKIVKSALGKFAFQKKQTQSPGKGLPQHPNYVLNLSCPLDEYDVCFEPQKTMIEFIHWDRVASFIGDATANFARVHGLEESCPESCKKRFSQEDPEADGSREYGAEIITENTKNALHSLAVKRTKVSSETSAKSTSIRSMDYKGKEQQEMSRIKLINNLAINPDAEVMCYTSSLDRLKRKVERLKQQENKTLDSSARSPSESRSVRLGNKCARISRGSELANLKEFQFDRRRKTLSRTGASADRISTSSPQTKKTNPTAPIYKKQQNVLEISPPKINTRATKIAISDKTRECLRSADKTNSFASKADCHQMGDSKSSAISTEINSLGNATERYQHLSKRPRPTTDVTENACQAIRNNTDTNCVHQLDEIDEFLRDSKTNTFTLSQSETDCAIIDKTSNVIGNITNSLNVENIQQCVEVRKLLIQDSATTLSKSETKCAIINKTSNLIGSVNNLFNMENVHQFGEVGKFFMEDSETKKCSINLPKSEAECSIINRTSDFVRIDTNSSSVENICRAVPNKNRNQITSLEDNVMFSSHGSDMNNLFLNASDKPNSSQTLLELSLEVAISDKVTSIAEAGGNKVDSAIYFEKATQMSQIKPAERPTSRNTSGDLQSHFEDRDWISRLEMSRTSEDTTGSPVKQKQSTVTNGLDIDNAYTKGNRLSKECSGKDEDSNTKMTWIPYEDCMSGNTIYINAETGNSSYDPPFEPSSLTPDDAKEDEIVPSNHFVLSHNCNPFLPRPISERPVFDGVQNSQDGQVSNMLKKWTNPIFQRSQEVLSLTPSGPSKTSAVKVYNTLQQYRFDKTHLRHVKFVGQVDCKFIACLMSYQGDDNLLVLFDQHAVHERIRLEKFVEEVFEDKPEGQCVIKTDLKPTMVLEVEQQVARRASMYREQMSKWGMDVSVDLPTRLEVHAVPACLMRKGYPNETVIQNLVSEELQTLHETGCLSTLPKTLLDLLSSRACHGAIKFGDPLEPEKAKEMILTLSKCKLPFQCAHGRPSLAPILDLRHLPRAEPDDEDLTLDDLKLLE